MSKYNELHSAEVPLLVASRDVSAIPGPSPAPVLGWRAHQLAWARDPIGHLTKMYKNYGLLSTLNPKNPDHVFAFGPEYNQRMFSEPDRFHAAPLRRQMPADTAMGLLRSNLLNLDGPQHKQRRRMMQPTFHRNNIEGFRAAMADIIRRMLDGWQAGEVRDIERDMRRLVHNIAMKVVFSLEDPNDVNALDNLIARLYSSTLSFSTMLFPFNLPGTSYRKMMRVAEEIVEFLKTMIEKKRANSGEQHDVLSMLIAARDENGVAMSDTELVAEAYNVLCHETSASAITWAVLLLAQHPQEHANLLDELESELHGDAPTIEQLGRLPLLDRVIKESLRLLPAGSFGRRFSTEACQFGSYEIPEGAMIVYSQYITHRLPELYQQPERFLPQRWESLKPTPYQYLPFGAGAHNCLGSGFAMVEMKMVLAMMVQRYRIAIVPGARIDRNIRMSLRPKNGLPATISPQDRQFARSPLSGNINEMVDFN